MKKLIPLICAASLFMVVDNYTKAQENSLTREQKTDQKMTIEENTAVEKTDNGENRDKEAEANEWVRKGTEAFNAKDFEKAIIYYKKATVLNPNSVEAHYNLGLTYAKKEMPDEAIAAYKKTTAINPKYAKAYNNLGTAYQKKGMADESFLMYQKAVEANPDLAAAQYNLGRSYLLRESKDPQNKSLAAQHLHKAGVLFIEMGNQTWASHAYTALKRTEVKKLEQDLYEKLYPQEKK